MADDENVCAAEYLVDIVCSIEAVVGPGKPAMDSSGRVAVATCEDADCNGNVRWVTVPAHDPPTASVPCSVSIPSDSLPDATPWDTAPSSPSKG